MSLKQKRAAQCVTSGVSLAHFYMIFSGILHLGIYTEKVVAINLL